MSLIAIVLALFAASSAIDASWARAFTGRENQLNGDPRFHALLKASLPQHQTFWRDRGTFTPVADLVHTFIGVPGDALLDEDRYLTADGCVPHDCYDRGMVWIDTAAKPAAVIFVATGLITNGPTDTGTNEHLWIFSSVRPNWQKMPRDFLSSLTRWWTANRVKGYDENIALVTLVGTNDEMQDLSPGLFGLGSPRNKPTQ